MQIPLFVVDAFTTVQFRGNPAAVCQLSQWLPEPLMQAIAAENNLAETAFLVPRGTEWELRWFTPAAEVDLCGHATLASAFVLADAEPDRHLFRFHTKSGLLTVSRQAGLLTLDFPVRTLETLSDTAQLGTLLGCPVQALFRAANILVADLGSEAAVRGLQPDARFIRELDCRALSVTARGDSCDFVSRFFAPKMGIDEDAVTGSAHCALVPYWADKLGKSRLLARQLSRRGGELQCELKGDRVLMGGHAVLYSKGLLYLP